MGAGFTRGLLAGLFLLGTVMPTNIESGRWWHRDRVVAELRLTMRQRQEIDRIYNFSFRERAACAARVVRARAHLNQLLISDALESDVRHAAEESADAEAARGRARTWMLYRILRVLDSDQRERVPAMAATDVSGAVR